MAGFFSRIGNAINRIMGKKEASRQSYVPPAQPTTTKTPRVSQDDIPRAPRHQTQSVSTPRPAIPRTPKTEKPKSTRANTPPKAQKRITSYEEYTRQRQKAKERLSQKQAVKISKDVDQSVKRERQAADRLQQIVNENTKRIEQETNKIKNQITKNEINLASSSKTEDLSIYTKAEVQTMYRAFQHVWDRPGVKLGERNEVIVKYVNQQRMLAGKEPISMAEIMQATIDANKKVLDAQKATYGTDMDAADNADNRRQSPPSQVMAIIRDALDEFIVQPSFA